MDRFLLIGGGPKGLDAKLMAEWGFDVICFDLTENIEKYRDNLSKAEALYEIRDEKDFEGIVSAARKAHKEYPFSNAVSFTEWGLLPAAHVCDAFGFKGNGVDAVVATVNKKTMRGLLQKDGLSEIKFAAIKTLEEFEAFCRETNYNCVLKDPNGSGKMDLFIIHAKEDLLKYEKAIEECLRKHGYMLSEEFVSGTEISVETFSWDGELKFIAFTKKHKIPPYNVETGHTMPAIISDTQKQMITNYVHLCLKSLGVNYGICHNEVIYSDNKIHFVETHTRPGGGCIYDLIVHAYEVDIIKEACNFVSGRKAAINNIARSSAASRFFCPPGGHYKNILGGKYLETNPVIKDYFLELPSGGYLPEITNNELRHCYIVASANCPASQLDAQVDELMNKITFVAQ